MNRIQMLDQEMQTTSSLNAQASRTGTSSTQTVEHSFFVPLHYEPNYAYPLVVWLHGPGGGGHRQLKQVMPHVSMRNYVAVAPAWPEPTESNQSQSDAGRSQDANGIVETMYRVNDCVRIASQRFNIASQRVFLAGFDVGGSMACTLTAS